MQTKYRMFRRNGGFFYARDKATGRSQSLGTPHRAEAERLLNAKNQAIEQPHLNLAMARVYLSCKSPEMLDRTWIDVMTDMEQSYHGPTLKRWRTQMRSVPFQTLKKLKLLETDGTHFLNVLRHPRAGSSVHKWLRILHNRALDLGWLLAPVLARKLWPKFRTKKTKAITAEQHTRLWPPRRTTSSVFIWRCCGQLAVLKLTRPACAVMMSIYSIVA